MGLSEMLGVGAAEEGARKVTGRDVPGLLEAQNELLTKIVERLNRLPEGLRQSLADHLWAEIPSTFADKGYNPNATSVTTTPRNQGNPRRIETIYTYIGGNQTGFLTLGNQTIIPLPTGAFVIPKVAEILTDADTATLTAGTPGSQSSTPTLLFVGLFGHVLPRWGEFT